MPTLYTAKEVCERAGITRTTLWHWRKAKSVPAGCHYSSSKNRGTVLVFTASELEEVLKFANRLDPIALERDDGSTFVVGRFLKGLI